MMRKMKTKRERKEKRKDRRREAKMQESSAPISNQTVICKPARVLLESRETRETPPGDDEGGYDSFWVRQYGAVVGEIRNQDPGGAETTATTTTTTTTTTTATKTTTTTRESPILW